MRCYILDDEQHCIDLIEDYIKETPGLILIGTSTKALEVKHAILTGNLQIDILFLDIKMPDIDGIEMAKAINKNVKIIFTTAYRHYGSEAFSLLAVDYLLKPFSYERFNQAIGRFQQMNNIDYLFIKTTKKGKWLKVNSIDILYIEAKLNYVIFHLENKETISSAMTMSDLEDKLRFHLSFRRIHRSFVVNQHNVLFIENKSVVLTTNIALPISRTYYSSVIDSL